MGKNPHRVVEKLEEGLIVCSWKGITLALSHLILFYLYH